MAKFMYQARNAAGKIVTGVMDAIDDGELRVKLKAQNLTPLKVSQMAGGPGLDFSSFFQERVPTKELQIFTRQFSTLVSAGIPIVDGLKILSEGRGNQLLKSSAHKVKTAIESGRRLGDAMAAHPNVFDKFYVNMVRAGEEAGILDNILNRLAIYMEKNEKIKKQVKGALVLPGVILAISIIVIGGLLFFVIPKFQEMYSGAGQELPFVTQMVVNFSEFLKSHVLLVLGVLIGAPIGFMQWYRTPEGKAQCDRMAINMPVFGELVRKSAIARMTRTMSTLLSSGVGVVDALEIAARTSGNKVIEDTLLKSKEAVTAGKPLASPLGREKNIPDMVTQMISIGEQSGTLDVMLAKIADFYEDDVENAVKSVTTLIEPLMMVFLGGTVAILLIAMYLPIFNMASVVGGGV